MDQQQMETNLSHQNQQLTLPNDDVSFQMQLYNIEQCQKFVEEASKFLIPKLREYLVNINITRASEGFPIFDINSLISEFVPSFLRITLLLLSNHTDESLYPMHQFSICSSNRNINNEITDSVSTIETNQLIQDNNKQYVSHEINKDNIVSDQSVQNENSGTLSNFITHLSGSDQSINSSQNPTNLPVVQHSISYNFTLIQEQFIEYFCKSGFNMQHSENLVNAVGDNKNVLGSYRSRWCAWYAWCQDLGYDPFEFWDHIMEYDEILHMNNVDVETAYQNCIHVICAIKYSRVLEDDYGNVEIFCKKFKEKLNLKRKERISVQI